MDKKLSVDLSILAPVLLGVVSLLGICAVLLIGRYSGSRVPVQMDATDTPFKYLYLGTEPGISTLTPEPTETPPLVETPIPFMTDIDTQEEGLPTFSVVQSATPTLPGVRTATPTRTPTLSPSDVIYDDTDLRFVYEGDWVSQSNVNGAYQNSLHISFTAGNSVLFTFVGQQMRLSYQAGPSLGRILINIDGLEVQVDQVDSVTRIKEWQSALLVQGTHTLLVTHFSGGSVNLDSVTVILIPTQTPTPNGSDT
jgi:hypothetical protein